MRDSSRTSLFVATLALLLAASAGPQSSTDEAAEEPWAPCVAEMVAMGETREEASAAPVSATYTCPCFEAEDLENLQKGSWDLCVQGTYVEQVASWWGPRSASGQEGFNVLVSLANPRCQQSSCLFLHRHPSLDGMQQVHRRFVNISEDQAAECRRLLSDWIAGRKGCTGSTVSDRR